MHLHWQLLVLSLVSVLHLCGAQDEAAALCLTSETSVSCTECFGRGQKSSIETRLIPDLEFTCNGTVVSLTVSGRLREGTVDPKIQVWRRDESSEDDYYILGEIPINVNSSECEEIAQLPSGSTFHCRVDESLQVTVESGLDIIGVELPPLEEQSFEIFFTNGSQIQYACSEELTENGTVRLSSCDSVVTTDLLLLSVNISTDVSDCTTICEQNCTYTSGSFECTCFEGYTLAEDGQTCLEDSMDVCSEVTHNCQHRCVNATMPGDGFRCECFQGYELNSDNETCRDIDECAHNIGGCEYMCSNSNGSFACMCRDGYRLGDDGLSCHDIDECAENTDNCQHNCSNTEGSFQCSCYQGYSVDNSSSDGVNCTDDNECTSGTHNCSQRCINIDGAFRCECETGYQLDSDAISCRDIDECATNSSGGCQQLCINSNGTYSCNCESGYQLESDGQTCTDINECTTGTHNCSQKCVNTDGGFRCECKTGYQLDADGANCLKIDVTPPGEVAGATVTVLVVVIAIMSAITLFLFFLRRSKKTQSVSLRSHTLKRKIEHTISLPYLVENSGCTEGNTSPRGPRILVLNAPTQDEEGTNLEFYNSLFDEGDMDNSPHDGTVIYNV